MNTINKMLLVLIASIVLSGCAGYDGNVCYEGVKAKYPDSKIILIPGEKYRFIVKTPSGDVLYVETMNLTNGEPTQEFVALKSGE